MDNQFNETTAVIENLEQRQEEPQRLYAGKYKTPEDLERGYKELSTLVREKRPEAPEAYDFSTVEGIDSENPLLNRMQEVMKDQNLTQDQAESITKAFIDYHESMNPNMEEEIKKLGSEGSVMVQQVEGFMRRHFTPEEAQLLSSVGYSAAGVKLLHKLSQRFVEKSIPAYGAGVSLDAATDLRQKAAEMFKDPSLRTDSSKQEAYDAIWQRIAQLER